MNMQFKFAGYIERSKREGDQTIQRKLSLEVCTKLPRDKPVLDGCVEFQQSRGWSIPDTENSKSQGMEAETVWNGEWAVGSFL